MGIYENVKNILNEIPENVQIEAAAKTRNADEILEAIKAGITIIGENYISDLKKVYATIGKKVKWHFIGKLQKNNIRANILEKLDMIETIDNLEIAEIVNKKCANINKIMPVLIEINSGKEPQKGGILPENTINFIQKISNLPNIKIMGLMTMGPFFDEPEKLRPYFRLTNELFFKIKNLNIKNVEMKILSMGMSDSYKIAIEEGANLVRIGTKIFGPRS